MNLDHSLYLTYYQPHFIFFRNLRGFGSALVLEQKNAHVEFEKPMAWFMQMT